jgi:predicted phage baseplate assembly protein
LLPEGAIIHAQYQVGTGSEGNIGADQLVFARALTGPLSGAIQRVWNPFDVSDGRDYEPAEKIRRNAPEAYRARQLRAVTLADYVRRAEEVDGVSRAVARYAWTGSWRTVRVTIDPVGTISFDDALRQRVADHLESVRLIGEDLELRPPRFVPLDVRIVVCLAPEFWREDLRFILDQEFGTSYTSDGRRGFFHPDNWTFGQALHRSQIEGRLQQVAGVEHVVSITMKRFNAPTPGIPGTEELEMAFDEVVLLANDPDHLERGLIRFELRGGRV